MIHPDTELRYVSPEIGHGVFATRPIPKGAIVWVQDPLDRVISPEEMSGLDPMLWERASTYCYRDREGRFVMSWDHNRYINHSFNPNCMMTPYGLELAVRDIQPDEQLTEDYGTLNILEPFEPIDEGQARKRVLPDDLLDHHPEWDAKLAAAFPLLPQVEQPLRPLVPDDVWQTCLCIAAGDEPLLSIRNCHFGGRP